MSDRLASMRAEAISASDAAKNSPTGLAIIASPAMPFRWLRQRGLDFCLKIAAWNSGSCREMSRAILPDDDMLASPPRAHSFYHQQLRGCACISPWRAASRYRRRSFRMQKTPNIIVLAFL